MIGDIVIQDTPLEKHILEAPQGKRVVFVKREDLCCPNGPHFSKIRGVQAHIRSKMKEGISTFGVLDTFHSQAGWAVAYICNHLGANCINYYPRYKGDALFTLRSQQREASDLGATLVSLPAGRSAILYHQAKKLLVEGNDEAYMMPNALMLPESVNETAIEFKRMLSRDFVPTGATFVISASSGTIAKGLIQGLRETGFKYKEVFVHLGYSRSIEAVKRYIGTLEDTTVHIVDEGYQYKDSVKVACPFPVNPYYDAKTWLWLVGKSDLLKRYEPIVFWNIGS